jgi:hypothetical protein
MPINAKVMFPGQIDSGVPEWNPPDYSWKILAEGDSWFSFGSWKLESLLTQLRLRRDAAVVTLAQPGDTIRHMADICSNSALRSMLSTTHGYSWDAILLSGGGNDVIDNAGTIVKPSAVPQPDNLPVAGYVDDAALQATLAAIRTGYQAIVALRDSPNSPAVGVPIVTHRYDLATPRNSPATFLVIRKGPWLYPAMLAGRIPAARWNDVSDYIIGALGDCLAGLELTLPNFHAVSSQGTLRRAAPGTTSNSNDWDNEIHPNRGGFRKIAAKLAEPVDGLLP